MIVHDTKRPSYAQRFAERLEQQRRQQHQVAHTASDSRAWGTLVRKRQAEEGGRPEYLRTHGGSAEIDDVRLRADWMQLLDKVLQSRADAEPHYSFALSSSATLGGGRGWDKEEEDGATKGDDSGRSMSVLSQKRLWRLMPASTVNPSMGVDSTPGPLRHWLNLKMARELCHMQLKVVLFVQHSLIHALFYLHCLSRFFPTCTAS